eukprot:2555540-Pleurochrysis_carterae.AAC.1
MSASLRLARPLSNSFLAWRHPLLPLSPLDGLRRPDPTLPDPLPSLTHSLHRFAASPLILPRSHPRSLLLTTSPLPPRAHAIPAP